jgi:CubicO group peptidase (beta-lactamase class C family)
LGSFITTAVPGGVAQALARCKALPVGAPGAIAPESRCSILLLNSIIVRVSGQPWPAAMHDLVFGPAQMVDSGQLTNAAIPPGWVQGYSAGVPAQLGNVDNYYLPYSSLQDLERLDRALLSGHLLSPEALRALFTPHISGGAVLARYFTANGSNATQLAGGYEAYLRTASPTTVLVADKPGFMGGISLDNALSPEDGTIAIMAKNVNSGPDPTDVLFGLAAHLLWGKPASSPPLAPPLGKPIAAYLTRARFNGYVYLERHGQVILNKGFGMADAEDRVPNTAQTRWPAFAATRFLVALAIMKLQEQGKLTVRQAICTYIRGCPAAWRPLTIEELLLNTSGMGSYDPFVPGVSLDQTMAACKASPLVSPPGSTYLGSDCNTFVLGAILEQVTGKTWAAAMQELVYGPAGMAHTGRMTNALRPPQRGRLYRAGVATPELNYDGYNLAYTTVDDLVRLGHALLAGRLISRQSRDAMFTPRLSADPSDPGAFRFGYEVGMWPATATEYQARCVSCVSGGGEDDTGAHSGFFITVWVSPEAGSVQIEVGNDSGYFDPGDADNAFYSFVSKALYGK